ncbi:MAG: hypothetical protein JNN08_23285 [Bryobacterales bacterium]|nr:hypothetical protein [Bryobacterales bacterium]
MPGAPRLLLRTSPAAEDLRFLPVGEAGVALEAATARLAAGEVDFRVRTQPVLLPEGKPYLVAVFTVSCADPSISAGQRARLSDAIARHANQHFLRAVQIDFAATVPQRASYREFLQELRPKLRNHQLLSVAVPAEWCREKEWVESLGADEIVPVQSGGQEAPVSPVCRFSAGVSSKQKNFPAGLRLYVTHDSPWDGQVYTRLHESVSSP